MESAILAILPWAFSAFLIAVLATKFLVTAKRPANDRESLLRGLPPPSFPAAARLAQLGLNARRELKRQALVTGPIIGLVLVAVGIVVVIHDSGPVGIGLAAIAVSAVPLVAMWELIAGIILFAHYLGARRRIWLDAEQSGRTGRQIRDNT